MTIDDFFLRYVQFGRLAWSMTLESLPFLLFGALVSAVVHTVVPEGALARHFPRNRFAALLAAVGAGIVVPLCECSIVPVARSLVTKGLPRAVAFTFMISAPLLNPVVVVSTALAFKGMPVFVALRFGVGVVAALGVGAILLAMERRGILAMQQGAESSTPSCCPTPVCSNAADAHDHEHARIGLLALRLAAPIRKRRSRRGLLSMVAVLVRTAEEFVATTKFFLLGVFVTSSLKLLLSIETVGRVGAMPLVATPFMMAFTYVSSVCSEADAFLARTFAGVLPIGAITAFLVYGPMIDLKNTVQLVRSFGRRTVVVLVAAISAVCLVLGLATTVVFHG